MKAVVLIISALVAASAPQGDGVIRLKPSDFRQLPSAVRRNLNARGCTVPQSPQAAAPHNVITGSFTASASRDWVVLCSVKGVSRLLVYRGGSTKRIDSLAALPDAGFMHRSSSGVVEFSRRIGTATPKNIVDHAAANGIPKPPKLTYDGIDDWYVEKTSRIHYFYRGKWREQQPAN
jgi:hypothetical protein